MKKIVFKALLIFLSFVSYSSYAQEKSDEKFTEQEEAFIKEYERQSRVLDEAMARASSKERSSGSARSNSSSSSGFSFGDGVYVMSNSGSSSSQMSLSKTFDGESKKNEGSFEVDETVRNISLTLSGVVKSGEIKIKITLSNGDLIKELTIDESADIQFSQNIKISEDVKKYYGKWRYIIESVKAEGTYKLMIQTR